MPAASHPELRGDPGMASRPVPTALRAEMICRIKPFNPDS
jgi:hypothetical protein